MRSWWRLRAQVFLVLATLLSLIVFLGTYALSGARKYAAEADEVLDLSVKAASLLGDIETSFGDKLGMAAKYRATRDSAYKVLVARHEARLATLTAQLQQTLHPQPRLGELAEELTGASRGMQRMYFVKSLREMKKAMNQERAHRMESVREVAKDLRKIIFAAFLVAIAVTAWLTIMLYYAVLQPIEAIKNAARRIREGELSFRANPQRGVEELGALCLEFNAMAGRIEDLDRMKSEFLSTVSHELNTPLTAIKEGLGLLTEKQANLPPAALARTLEVCNQSVKRLETMIQNLLNHSRMESGFYQFEMRPKDFVATIESAISGVRAIAERRRQAIEFKAHTTYHHAAFSVEGITHAVENLVLNAIKYGDNAYPIRVDVRRLDQRPVPQLEVRVTNRGRTLLPSELILVFDKFFRGSNSDGTKGVGLGLSVVKRIIEAHHGRVFAESEDGVTVFAFHIPQQYQSEAPLEQSHAVPSVPAVIAGPETRSAGGAVASLSLLLAVCGLNGSLLSGCARIPVEPSDATVAAEPDLRREELARLGIELLQPESPSYNPEKGKLYLERSLRNGDISSLEVPAPVLLELLRGEKVATEKSRTLEQQLRSVKRIDQNRSEGI